MNEKELNSNNSADNMPENNSAEFISRAEKIKAIKNSISNNRSAQQENDVSPVIENAEPQQTQSVSETNSDDWESEIAERISARVKKLKSNKNAELLELLNSTEKSKENVQTEENNSFVDRDEIVEQDNLYVPLSVEPVHIREYAYSDFENAEEYVPESHELPPVQDDTSDRFSEAIPQQPVIAENVGNKVKKKKSKKKKSFKQSFLGLFPQKKDSVFEKCRKIVFLTSVIAIVVCGTIVLEYYIDTSSTQHAYEDLMDGYHKAPVTTQPVEDEGFDIQYLMMPDAESLYKINPDVVGVINIPDTEIFYPVLKGKDNDEYLNKTIYGEEARAGSIFMDYRNSFDEVKDGKMQERSDNIILYGHEMATGKMFGQLKEYKDNTYFYEEHPIIEFNSNYFCYKYKIFSIMIVDSEDKTDTKYEYWNKLNFEDEDDFYNFVNEAKRRTVRLNDVDVKYGDEILTLSTCNGIFGKDAGGRLVVMARKVREGEDLLEGTQNSSANPNIKWPSIYYNYNSHEKYDPKDFVPYS